MSFVCCVREFCDKQYINPACGNLTDEILHSFFENKSAETRMIHADCIRELLHKVIFYAHGGQLPDVRCNKIVLRIMIAIPDVFVLMIDSARFTYELGTSSTNDQPFIVITTKYGKVLRPIFIDDDVAWF